jgi:hypothetical protein
VKRLIALSSLLFVFVVKLLSTAIGASVSNDSSAAPAPLCAEPSLEWSDRCALLEAQILSATVRISFQTWAPASDGTSREMLMSGGHATVKDGRYLVTHNHYDIPLSIRHQEGEPESYTHVYLYDAAGELRHSGPLTDFSIVVEDMETLVLAHKESSFFEALGFTSAEFKSWAQLPLGVGMEVAQVDWDGKRARVDWATVSDLAVENGVPRIVLDDGAMAGASGGGIFWQGTHIANNWRAKGEIGSAGDMINRSTTAALNSQLVVSDSSCFKG